MKKIEQFQNVILRYFIPYLHWIKGMNTNGIKSIFQKSSCHAHTNGKILFFTHELIF